MVNMICASSEKQKKIHLCFTGIPGQQAAELEVGVGKAATRAGSVQSRSQKQLPGAPRCVAVHCAATCWLFEYLNQRVQ